MYNYNVRAARGYASSTREKKLISFLPYFLFFLFFLLRRAAFGGETHKISSSFIAMIHTKFIYNNNRLQRRGCDL